MEIFPLIQEIQSRDLKPFNSFGIACNAQKILSFSSEDDLMILSEKGFFDQNWMVLGGGSNVLFTKDFSGAVLLNRIGGIEAGNLPGSATLSESKVKVKVGAGQNWHQLVVQAVTNGWGGIENLALIPGCAGAAPIQNIGAYGVELKEYLQSVRFFDVETGRFHVLENNECLFGYRNSIFKNELKGKVIVVSVELGLSLKHEVKTDYGAIGETLAQKGISQPTIKDVMEAVIEIRKSKLPDPVELGNAGSFFKNPVIEEGWFSKLRDKYPEMPFYPQKDGIKVPAGWLIETAGWKGKRVGNTGCHARQALAIVNYGGATGAEIAEFARMVQMDVFSKFGIELEMEVNLV